jgi:hypothetical protein
MSKSVAEAVMVTCDSKGCSHAPLFTPKINVPFAGMSLDQHEPLAGFIGLRLCERHIGEVNVKDFSNLEPMFELLAGNLPNELKIDWPRAWFSKVRLDSQEFKDFEKLSQ